MISSGRGWSWSWLPLLCLLPLVRGQLEDDGDLLEVKVEEVSQDRAEKTAFTTLLLGGNKTEKVIESFSERTFCKNGIKSLPSIRFAASGCHVRNSGGSILMCGGRKDLFSLSSSCWMYSLEKESWEEADSLPVSVAGAATICQEDRMMMIGGVVEEDYYQDKNTEDYYDYNTEVATSQVLLYDFKSQKWDYGTSFPESIQGACGGSIDNMIIVTGGKNDRECSYGTDNVWMKKDSEWMKGPPMIHARFHHACHVTKIGHKTGLLVVGGLGPDNVGDRVEFMAISNALKEMHWTILPSLNQPHPNQPMIGNIGDHVMVVGGGGFPYPGGENVAEILTNNRWTSFKHVGVDRAFGLAIQVPEIFTEKCEMEPNYGGHHYFKRKGEMWLRNKIWFCNGDQLELPLEAKSSTELVVDRCTVPGCPYYQIPREHVTQAATLGCEVSSDLASVVCSIHCASGYRPLGGHNTRTCSRQTRTWDIRYLECQKEIKLV